MPYLIDGHNLIGQTPGLHLGEPDDEAQLIELLRAFCARTGSRATVYFDRGHPAAQAPPSGGRVSAHFITAPQTADQAIVRHLRRLRGEARNWTVVSSDREVERAAAGAGAQRLASREFARRLRARTAVAEPEKPENPLTKEDLEYWEKRFRRRRRPRPPGSS
jgi:predicted RNA-binding protein with PIN domain